MKYFDKNRLKDEIIISFNNDELSIGAKTILSQIIDMNLSTYSNTYNGELICKWYVKQRLFGGYWKRFNINKIDDAHLPHFYYIEVIKRLMLISYKNKETIEYKYIAEMKREDRKMKLEKIMNMNEN